MVGGTDGGAGAKEPGGTLKGRWGVRPLRMHVQLPRTCLPSGRNACDRTGRARKCVAGVSTLRRPLYFVLEAQDGIPAEFAMATFEAGRAVEPEVVLDAVEHGFVLLERCPVLPLTKGYLRLHGQHEFR
eukprot:scaffold2858_cov659-Pavlova_lutheri.AAC.1